MTNIVASGKAGQGRGAYRFCSVAVFSLLVSLASAGILAGNPTELYLATLYSRTWSNCVGNLAEGTLLAEDEAYRKTIDAYTARKKKLTDQMHYMMGASPADGALQDLIAEHDVALYKCSGLILRGTRQNTGENNAWDPYPEGRVMDTSFSFLRADIKMKRLAWSYTNGFIIDPPTDLKVNCFYPQDAESDSRSQAGCGAHARIEPKVFLCEDDPEITDEIPPEFRCLYDLRGTDAVAQFKRGVAAAAKFSHQSAIPNDLKIQTWNKGYDKRLKIRAFFYVNDEGKPFARRDRDAYEKVSGIRVPLVALTFPAGGTGDVTFKVVD
ncbi:hypothetical protein [Pseudomonas sp. zfem002]|uniref:hypothetical protein n=1 Tax=Pseudomonas sp. zfem002 TaxID=3078197 RepID=UPI00292962DD|nr:hypothetical protein [Pseudomonas sp. zfem002]MDU9389146.1 hypothetical protein [Pseudomonas sp. zfem002]